MRYIKTIFKDKNRKSTFNIVMDLVRMMIKYKSFKGLSSYGLNLMYKEDAGKFNEYIHNSRFESIYKDYYRKNGEDPILQDKIAFSLFFKKNQLPTAKFLGKLEKGNFEDAYGYEVEITNRDHLKENIQKILKENKSIFIKENDSQAAQGVMKVQKNTINRVNSMDLSKNYLIEETIIQHPYISQINPDCINSLRVITYRENNDVKIASCFFRMGLKGSDVDNASSGGIFIDYDIYNDKLGKIGYKKFKYGGGSYYEHPDSNFVFENQSLPFSLEVIEMVTKASLLFDREVIGWDIAYTPDGPVFIEGNDNPAVDSLQVACRGVLSNEVYKKAFKGFY